MSRGLGHIERAIAAEIAHSARPPHPMSVHNGSHQLADTVYRPRVNSGVGFGNPGSMWNWEPNLVQQKATVRAMHRVCPWTLAASSSSSAFHLAMAFATLRWLAPQSKKFVQANCWAG